MRRRETAEPEAVDRAEEAVVADAEGIVVDIGALQALELVGVMIVSGVEGIAVVLEGRKGQGKGVAAAPERLLFAVQGKGFSFQLSEFSVQGRFFLLQCEEIGKGPGFSGTGRREGGLGCGDGRRGGDVVSQGFEKSNVGISFLGRGRKATLQ